MVRSMASTPSYRHKPLEYEDSIRVLLLLPSTNPQDPIRIDLAPCRLSEIELYSHSETDFDPNLDCGAPRHQDRFWYEALSYAWGDPTDTAPIYVGDGSTASLPVTRNCLNALKALRQKDRPRRMWIDAICINQTDLDERSSQVRLMARIYAAGSCTVIYLGEHTSCSRVVFESADDIGMKFRTYSMSKLKSQEAFWEYICRPELRRGLDDLLQRSWFRRVWVAQEIFANEERLVLCGENTISYGALDCLFRAYWVTWGYGLRRPFTWAPKSILSSYNDTSNTICIRDRLWNSLVASRELLASDSRDKIFAMRALIGKQHVELDPLIDYNKTPEQVFTLLAKVFLRRFGLKTLGLVRHGHDLHMPSWVPDWSQNTPLSSNLEYKSERDIFQYFGESIKSEVESIHGMGQCRQW